LAARKQRRFTQVEMHRWLQDRVVVFIGADLDESPMAYRRPAGGDRRTCRHHQGAAHAVAIAGAGELDPFKD
jgi:tRNA-splicing ligase RtcB (3'-phosphate/5'-hydroxy nucleic acid ligase)